MNTKNTIVFYTILGIIFLLISYTLFYVANIASKTPENQYYGVLLVVSSIVALVAILLFIPVAAGLIFLSNKK
jgi:uncharacterized membrane protein